MSECGIWIVRIFLFRVPLFHFTRCTIHMHEIVLKCFSVASFRESLLSRCVTFNRYLRRFTSQSSRMVSKLVLCCLTAQLKLSSPQHGMNSIVTSHYIKPAKFSIPQPPAYSLNEKFLNISPIEATIFSGKAPLEITDARRFLVNRN